MGQFKVKRLYLCFFLLGKQWLHFHLHLDIVRSFSMSDKWRMDWIFLASFNIFDVYRSVISVVFWVLKSVHACIRFIKDIYWCTTRRGNPVQFYKDRMDAVGKVFFGAWRVWRTENMYPCPAIDTLIHVEHFYSFFSGALWWKYI